MSDGPYVFVSYPREDLDLVREELNRLEGLGIRLDYASDEAPIAPERLKNAAFYLVLVSDSTEDDPHLRKEVSAALQEGKEGLCVHVFDVPLDGPMKLLLKSLPRVNRPSSGDAGYEAKLNAYVRRIVQALPDDVKTRPIELPGDERVAPPPPSRANTELTGGVGGLGNAAVAGIALLVVVLILGVLKLAISSGDDPSPSPSVAGASPTPDDGERPKASRPKRPRPRPTASPGASAAELEAKARDAIRAAEDAFAKREDERVIELLAILDAEGLSKEANWRHNAHLLRARALVRSRKRKEALPDFDVAVAASPNDAKLRTERAESRAAAGETEGALEDFGKVLELTPKNDFAWLARGDYYLELKRYPEAIADYTKAIELQPKSKAGYLKRSRARELAGDAKGALEDREASLR